VQAFDTELLPELCARLSRTQQSYAGALDYPAVWPTESSPARPIGAQRFSQRPPIHRGLCAEPMGGIVAPRPDEIARHHRNHSPLAQIERSGAAEDESSVGATNRQQEEAKLRHTAWAEQYKAAQKSGKAAPARPDDSIQRRYAGELITQDATAEKLHEIMRDNPAGCW